MATVSKVITAQNTFTDPLVAGRQKCIGISVYSTALSATIVLQRKVTGAADGTYKDIASWTSNVEKILESVGTWTYRLGVKTGGFTSATALEVSLSA